MIFRFSNSYIRHLQKPRRDKCRFYVNMSKFVPDIARHSFPTKYHMFRRSTFSYIIILFEMSFSCNILWHGTSKYWSSISSGVCTAAKCLLALGSPFPNYELVYGILLCNLGQAQASILSATLKSACLFIFFFFLIYIINHIYILYCNK